MKKEIKTFIFWAVIYIGIFLPICLLLWIVWPLFCDTDTHKLIELIGWVMAGASYIPIFLAQSVLGGCWTYIFFRKKNRPALFWVACSVIALVLVLLILYFMILYAFWRNDGWLFGINVLQKFRDTFGRGAS